MIKILESPYWEFEEVFQREDGSYWIQFSSRNSGCADFFSIPVKVVAEAALERQIVVSVDAKRRYIEK